MYGRVMLGEELAALSDALTGNTIGGVFPPFAAAFVHRTLADAGLPSGWHYRLAELGALTAGAFGMEPATIPKLSMCCGLWGVPAVDLETAEGAAFTAAACFERLAKCNAKREGLRSAQRKMAVCPSSRTWLQSCGLIDESGLRVDGNRLAEVPSRRRYLRCIRDRSRRCARGPGRRFARPMVVLSPRTADGCGWVPSGVRSSYPEYLRAAGRGRTES